MPQTLDALKQKYASAIMLAQTTGHLENVHIQDEKLFIRAEVPNEDVKNNIWNAIKSIDAQYADLTADISVNSAMPQPAAPSRTYTVKSGDTLSAVAKQFYGDASAYHKIFEANRDKLKDADHIGIGQVLVIPA